jgi:long-chain acyl-CoA synthetase
MELIDTATEGSEQREQRIRGELIRVNRSLHPWERIRHYRLVDDSPSVENGCLTETLKLRRHVVERNYGSLCTALS